MPMYARAVSIDEMVETLGRQTNNLSTSLREMPMVRRHVTLLGLVGIAL